MSRFQPSAEDEVGKAVVQAASNISSRLGYQGLGGEHSQKGAIPKKPVRCALGHFWHVTALWRTPDRFAPFGERSRLGESLN